jgi:hypothetical protein
MYLEDTLQAGISRSCAGWVLEADGAAGYEPIYATYLGEDDCPTAATYSLCKSGEEDSKCADGEKYTGMYSWKPEKKDSVSMSFTCKSYPMCGTLQPCVLA